MRRSALIPAAAAAALALVLTSCSTDRGSGSGGGGGKGAAATDTLNMTATGPVPTFVRNWNAFSPAEKKAPGVNFFYEPLLRIDHLDNKQFKGWLAKSYDWSDGGKTVTFHLRDGVTWSDGKPFTSKDVAYTFETTRKTPGLAVGSLGYEKLSTPDDKTVVITYKDVAYQKLADYSARNIYPAHIWEKQDAKGWTNPTPVGTGPATLTKFSPQQISLTVRNDWWGGKSKGVKKINIKSYTTPETAKAMLLRGDLDWSSINWQDAEKYFTSKDPKNNHYWVYPTGGDEGLNFNTGKAPLDDVHVRRALAWAADPEKLLKLAVTGQVPAGLTGFDSRVYSSLISDAYKGQTAKVDLNKAKAELAKSSYKLNSAGVLTKGGKSYPLTIKPVVEYTNWAAWGDGIAEQWKEALGVKVKVIRTPEDQLWGQLGKGDYDMAFDWQAGGNSPWAGYFANLHSSNSAPEGKPAVSNYVRWNDKATDKLLDQWRVIDPSDLAKQKEYASQLQKTVVDNVPFKPLFSGSWFIDATSKHWTNWPTPENATYVPHPTLGPETTLTVMNLKPVK